MNFWLTLIGGASGGAAAFAIHYLFRVLRRSIPTPLAVLGRNIAIVVVVIIGSLIPAFLDPGSPMSPVWLTIALLLCLLLLLCTSIGVLHSRYFKLPWRKTFGIMMTEAGVVIGTSFLLHSLQYQIAYILRRGSREVEDILRSFEQARYMLLWFNIALVVVLLLLELLNHERNRPLQ